MKDMCDEKWFATKDGINFYEIISQFRVKEDKTKLYEEIFPNWMPLPKPPED